MAVTVTPLLQTVIVGSYLIAHGFFSVYGMCVDTLFLCFCEWPRRGLPVPPPRPVRVPLSRFGVGPVVLLPLFLLPPSALASPGVGPGLRRFLALPLALSRSVLWAWCCLTATNCRFPLPSSLSLLLPL